MNTLTRLTLAAAAVLPMAVAMAQSATTEPANANNAVRHRAKQLELLDANKDGRLSRAEVQPRGGLTQSFDAIDTDRDGYLERDELRQWAQTQPATHPRGNNPNPNSKHEGKFFGKHDLNHDGVLTADEAAKSKRGGEMFSQADANGDGKVTKKEAHALRKAHQAAPKRPPAPKERAPAQTVQPLAPSTDPNP
ncbi:MAG: EF-hand domain-containing protein [Proteobacteria bacterium]|nr:EF-hand domain-containing protein [Pseudomonadota bacterium]